MTDLVLIDEALKLVLRYYLGGVLRLRQFRLAPFRFGLRLGAPGRAVV